MNLTPMPGGLLSFDSLGSRFHTTRPTPCIDLLVIGDLHFELEKECPAEAATAS